VIDAEDGLKQHRALGQRQKASINLLAHLSFQTHR